MEQSQVLLLSFCCVALFNCSNTIELFSPVKVFINAAAANLWRWNPNHL